MLSRNESYHESGANSFDEHRREHVVDRLTRQFAAPGAREPPNEYRLRNPVFST
jgi:hypothetical protein